MSYTSHLHHSQQNLHLDLYRKKSVQMNSPSYLCNLADKVPFLKTETLDLANVLKYERLANKKIQYPDLQKRKWTQLRQDLHQLDIKKIVLPQL